MVKNMAVDSIENKLTFIFIVSVGIVDHNLLVTLSSCTNVYPCMLIFFPTRNTGLSQVLVQGIKEPPFNKYSTVVPAFTLFEASKDIGQDWIKASRNHLLLMDQTWYF